MTHSEFLKTFTPATRVFFAACKLAGIPATTRQVSKWHRHVGLAHRFTAQAEKEILEGK